MLGACFLCGRLIPHMGSDSSCGVWFLMWCLIPHVGVWFLIWGLIPLWGPDSLCEGLIPRVGVWLWLPDLFLTWENRPTGRSLILCVNDQRYVRPENIPSRSWCVSVRKQEGLWYCVLKTRGSCLASHWSRCVLSVSIPVSLKTSRSWLMFSSEPQFLIFKNS